MMWYKKRKDPEALYVAKQVGIEEVFLAVGDILHEDDLEGLRTQLFEVSKDTIDCLFTKTEL